MHQTDAPASYQEFHDFPQPFADKQFFDWEISRPGLSSPLLLGVSNRCQRVVQEDIQRYLGRKWTSSGKESLLQWDLERPRYVSKRPWIMNSSTRGLLWSLLVTLVVASLCRLAKECLARRRKGSGPEYVPLATNSEPVLTLDTSVGAWILA